MREGGTRWPIWQSAQRGHPETTIEHFDVADRRRRNLRGRRRLSPDQAVPRHELCRARSPGQLRRHLAHPPLSGHPLRQRPLHLWLSLQAVDRRADRDGRRNPPLHGRGHRRERSRPPHPLSPQDRLGRPGRARKNLWTIGGHPDRHRRKPSASPPTSCGCARAITGIRRATPPNGPAWRTTRAGSCIRRNWPEDLDYADKRVVVIGSGATAATLIPAIAGDCGAGHDAAALADLVPHRPQCDRDRRRVARARHRRDLDPRDRAQEDPARPGGLHRPLLHRARDRQAGTAGRGARLSRSRLRHRDAFHAELPALAAAHRLYSRRRPARSHPRRQGRRSSPTRSSDSPRPAFCCGPARFSKPTSSSPPPASISMCSATSTLPSTASRSSSPTRSPIAA